MSTQVDLFTNVEPTSVSPAIVKPFVSRSTFYQGDCLVEMDKIADKSVDMIFTDPPYRVISGGTKSKHASGWKTSVLSKNDGKIFAHNDISMADYLPQLFRVLKDDSHCYLMTNNLNLREALNVALDCGFKFHNLLVWKKNNLTANRWYMKNLEYILFFYKGAAKRIKNASTPQTLEINNILGNKIHPTEKPVDLITILIENSSSEGNIVLDPFMGSGSTGVACKKTGRHFIGIEKDEKYFDIAVSRVSAYCG